MGSRRTTKANRSTRQAARSRKACDICAVSCFIESMFILVIPNVRSYNLCTNCGGNFSSVRSRARSSNSGSTRPAFVDLEARLRESQREYLQVRERLRTEKSRGRELEKLLKEDGVMTERTWWNTPINEMSLEEIIKSEAEMEKLCNELHRHIAQRSAGSSFSTTNPTVVGSIQRSSD